VCFKRQHSGLYNSGDSLSFSDKRRRYCLKVQVKTTRRTTSLLPNSQFGRYEIRSVLGVGGMGEVYLAFDPTLRRQVALKLLPAEFTENKVRLSRFEREAYAASSLNHPNILTIYEIGHQDGHHFIATEYIDGKSLRQQMDHRLELREVLDIASQIADALSTAHEAAIVHRDIKPENVIVRRDGYVKVLDFGLAKLADDTASDPEEVNTEAPTRTALFQTDPGVVMGTVNYMSPEQARGLEVDPRSDIWSLGVVLYEMVAGKLPFEGPTTTDVLAMILHREPASLLLDQSSLPAELERIVEKALVKERDARYQNAKDLSLDLKRLKQRLELAAELERNIKPEEETRRVSTVGPGTTPITSAGTSDGSNATQTSEATFPAISSAEYLVGGIQRHKLATLAVATLVLVSLAAVAYFAFFSKRSQAISSVAVLPFANQSGDPNMDYLSDGLSESIINNLSQLRGLKVISRGSSFKYKGKEIDPEQVARDLGVQAIVTGRVIQRGDQLQVSAELVNVSDKTQMWGEQFNRKMVDALAVQTEISKQIAEKLKLRLTNAEQQQLIRDAEVNPQAYELLLKGRFEQGKGSVEGNKKAEEYFNQAIAIDEKYAVAYADLALSYVFMVGTGSLDPKEGTPKAEAAVKKALELDEGLAEAHQSLALIKSNAWDWVGAEQAVRRAIELNPNLAIAHSVYSYLLSCMGRHEQAIAEARRARELDPLALNQTAGLGYALYLGRQYDQAVEQLKKTFEIDKTYAFSHAILAYTYNAMGRHNEAIAEYEAHIRLAGDNASDQCYLGYSLAKAGRRNEAEAILKKLETSTKYVSPAELAVLYLGLGDKEKALSALERAYAAHDLQMGFLGVDPHYDPLRSEPRLQELIRKVGLPG
jgi:serine/threonine protein kinase/Tfp pilus assembly protein PilF